MDLLLQKPTAAIDAIIRLDGSKSIANRALIIQALCEQPFQINDIAKAKDTQLLQKALRSNEQEINIGHAGTAMRFLTSYYAIQTNRTTILSGSDRMHNRPIAVLVDALRKLGAEIEYIEKEGFPPLKIKGKQLIQNKITITADVSSQYISSLCMIAPFLENGLSIELDGELVSRPYIKLTLELMAYFDISYTFEEQSIHIPSQKYQAKNISIEADWTAASYYFSIVALAANSKIKLQGLQEHSLQGDSILTSMMELLQVKSTFANGSWSLSNSKQAVNNFFKFDFVKCPDLAQSLVCAAAGLGIDAEFASLQTLKIKETDRTAALQQELQKFNIPFNFKDTHTWILKMPYALNPALQYSIDTYDDHRMAMAFAPLALKSNGIIIRDAEVVEKSYPAFYDDFEKLGFKISKV
ncbi:UNVERIFIED_CONTAM: hypothetical protein GTU68_016856 [Idotea baltica]|nr:hypothetical protein [Idotea baltica]